MHPERTTTLNLSFNIKNSMKFAPPFPLHYTMKFYIIIFDEGGKPENRINNLIVLSLPFVI
jgi:hypothetical protein